MSGISIAELERLPGWEIISAGLADVESGHATPAACAVWIASPRLRRYGLLSDEKLPGRIAEPERVLYRSLIEAGGNAYGRYNALLTRVARFERALDHLMFRKIGPGAKTGGVAHGTH